MMVVMEVEGGDDGIDGGGWVMMMALVMEVEG